MVTVAGALWGTLCSAALSINGYNHSLRTKNPVLFQKLTALTGGDPNGIRYPVRQLAFDADVVFGPISPGVREAFVSSGTTGAGDVLLLEYTGGDRLRFVNEHYGAPPVASPAIRITGTAHHHFSYDYSRIHYGRLTVRLDGQQVLYRQGEIYFTAPGEVSVGRDLTGSGAQPFSGRLDVPKGVRLIFGE
jgi:hypothetical protein